MEKYPPPEVIIVAQLALDVAEADFYRLCDIYLDGNIKVAAALNTRLHDLEGWLHEKCKQCLKQAYDESMQQEVILLKSLDESADKELTAQQIFVAKLERIKSVRLKLQQDKEGINTTFHELRRRTLELNDKVWEKM